MKDRIIYTAIDLFRMYGIKTVTINELAKEAGVSKTALYERFSSKEEILAACLEERIEREKSCFKKSGAGLLDLLLYSYNRVRELYPIVYNRCCWDIHKYYENTYKQVTGYITVFAEYGRERAYSDIEEGYIRKEIDPELFCAFIKSHFSLLFFSKNYCNPNPSQKQFAEAILIFARGISTLKGRGYIDKKIKEIRNHEVS